MQSIASWESAQVRGREWRRGSYTEFHRRECGGQELARDVAALVYELQKYIRRVFYMCPLICVSVKLVYGSSPGFLPQSARSCIMEYTHSHRYLLNDHTMPFTVPGSRNIEMNETQCLTLRSLQSSLHSQEFNYSYSLALAVIHSTSTFLSARHCTSLVGGDKEIQKKIGQDS